MLPSPHLAALESTVVVEPPDRLPGESPAPPTVGRPASCVLIADDEPNNRKTLQMVLAPLGYALEFAADGPETLAQAARLQPDLILLDVMMPGMDGFVVCQHLRADPRLAEVPIILVTSLDDRASRLRGLEVGADDFVSKPFDRAELRARVRTVVRLNRYRRLTDERARFERLFELSPDGILLVGRHGEIGLSNCAARRLLGCPAEDTLEGRRLAEFLPPGAQDPWLPELLRVETQPDWTVAFELDLRRLDGGLFPAEVTLAGLPDSIWAAQVLLRDISARRRVEADLRLAAKVFEVTAEGILVTDAQQRILAVNSAFLQLTGYTLEALQGQPIQTIYQPQSRSETAAQIAASLREAGHWHGEVRGLRRNRELYPAQLTLNTVRAADGTVTHYVGALTDLTERRQTEERLRVLAYHDPVTGLPNRTLFETLVQQALAKAARDNTRGAVLLVDLDDFKRLIETRGHAEGDRLIAAVADRLRSLAEDVVVAHLGGHEFAFLLNAVPDREAVERCAQQIRAALAVPFELAGQSAYCTASLGISQFPEDGKNPDGLLQNAEAALYRAREQGRNSVAFYTADLTIAAQRRLALETALRLALQRDEFQVYYQPRVALRTGRVVGMEALLRWRHPEWGMVAPGQFIGLAEETGLIVPIGEWILRAACTQARAWQLAGYPRLRVSVNIASLQVQQPDFVRVVERALRDTGLAADDLELELTESSLLAGTEETLERLNAVRALGVHLSLDDFGTGYASLDYLRRLPVNGLKIDRAFVRDLASQAGDGAILRTIVDLARSLALKVTAEGVETAEQLGLLQSYHCDEIQGFYFAAPLAAEAFVALL